MIQAVKDKQLMITVGNRVGTLTEVSRTVAENGINLIAICAYVLESRGFIVFVSDDNKKAKRVLTNKGYDIREEEVVVVTMDNKSGSLKNVSEKISDMGFDIILLYGSVEKKAKKSCIVVVVEEIDTVLTLLNAP